MAGGQSAANDDGEPSGTAGRPMLEVLRHQKLEGVLATVVRYYGGINLGAGGLVRAYTDAIAQALKGATKVSIVPMQRVACALPYALEGILRNRISQLGLNVLSTEKGMDLKMMLEGPEDMIETLMRDLTESSHGRIVWVKI
jgi:putative IMPACT (imprinted ancient) family translation regulator